MMNRLAPKVPLHAYVVPASAKGLAMKDSAVSHSPVLA
jgi:hypothetical protein